MAVADDNPAALKAELRATNRKRQQLQKHRSLKREDVMLPCIDSQLRSHIHFILNLDSIQITSRSRCMKQRFMSSINRQTPIFCDVTVDFGRISNFGFLPL
jgi:hypothetical protein